MTATQIRKQLRQYIDQVDEDYLTVLKVIIEDRLRINESKDDFFTDEEIEELERRNKEYLSKQSSGDTIEAVSERVLNRIQKKGK